MAVNFDFREEGNSPFGKISRPFAKIKFHAVQSSDKVVIWLIIDTGADYTILPRQWAKKLDIDLQRDCWALETSGIGGGVKSYFFKKLVKIEMGDIKKEVPVAFFDDDNAPALLGRLGFIELFDTLFVGNKQIIFTERR
ncbi:retropepsin-like domain-containing protein [Candidatus Gottesmanbacteria bacterium]|nr:retropepsin-like domain-containing protein [Candidatus Gottesmanbacteria bacterium]